jgi:two-component system response regulator ChvI
MHYDGFISGGGDNAYRGNVRSTITPIRKQIPRPRSGLAEIENYTAFGYRWGKPAGAD